jgi:molybdopterin synthase sulfur carrier subunit
MVRVEFLGPIGKAPVEMEASTLADVAAKLKEDLDLSEWLSKCAVALNDTMVNDLNTPLKDGDKVSILPLCVEGRHGALPWSTRCQGDLQQMAG